jgi:hypothetical protein
MKTLLTTLKINLYIAIVGHLIWYFTIWKIVIPFSFLFNLPNMSNLERFLILLFFTLWQWLQFITIWQIKNDIKIK